MNARTPPSDFTPIKQGREQTAPASDDCCDLCCAVPVVTEIDGDRMCQECADKWVRGERPDDDLVPLSTLYAMGVLPVRGYE